MTSVQTVLIWGAIIVAVLGFVAGWVVPQNSPYSKVNLWFVSWILFLLTYVVK